MKPTLEDLKLSAEACGYDAWIQLPGQGERHGFCFVAEDRDWNPPESPAQNWECLEELLRRGWTVEHGPDGEHCIINPLNEDYWVICLDCAPEDFACLALAEVKRREK